MNRTECLWPQGGAATAGNVRDASGKNPKPKTEHEKKWADASNGDVLKRRMEALQLRRAMPLESKIELSLQRIREWHEAWGGNVSVSYSGGKDSTVLLWLARRIDKSTPAVFVHTGLEYPEVVRHVMRTDNVQIIRPEMRYREVLERYGFPVGSKKIARGVSIMRDPSCANQNIVRLYDLGINRFGEKVNGFKIPDKWRFLVKAPFRVSDKCCEIMKKKPMHKYAKNTGRACMVGLMASDSKQREKNYLQYGCNAFDLKYPRSAPLSFWTEQDIMECLQKFEIEYPSVYGTIQKSSSGGLCFSGVRRTGCVFCCFGLHLDGYPNRFQQLFETHPRMWDYCMNRLGLSEILAFLAAHIPGGNSIFMTKPRNRHFQQSCLPGMMAGQPL